MGTEDVGKEIEYVGKAEEYGFENDSVESRNGENDVQLGL